MNVSEYISKTIVRPLHAKMVVGRRVRAIAGHLNDFLSGLSQESRGLDVGCGDGRIARLMMELSPGMTIEGIDIKARPDAVIEVHEFDGREIPCPDGAVDFSMLVHVLHHTESPELLLAECARVSKKAIFIVDHLCESVWDQARLRFMDWVGNRGYDIPLTYRYFSRSQWEDVFRKLGFTVEQERVGLNLYPFPFGCLFDGRLQVAFKLTFKE
jgi:SAM-dependent methyltransferase